MDTNLKQELLEKDKKDHSVLDQTTIEDNQISFSEDSEDYPEDTPAPTKKEKEDEEKSEGWFSSAIDSLKTKYERTTFKAVEKYFDDENYLKVITNLPPQTKDLQPKNILKKFNDKWRKITKEKLPKSQNDDDYIDELSNSTDRKVSLFSIVRRGIKKEFYWAVFFKILMRLAFISLPYVLKEYLKDVKSFKRISILESVGWCLLAGMLTFWGYVWGQLSSKWSGATKIRVTEMVRDSIYIHITDSNIDFLSEANSSFISKLMLYELKPLENFVDAMIELCSSPIPLLGAFTAILFEFAADLYSLIFFGFFAFLIFFVYRLHKIVVFSKKKVRTYGSLCTGQIETLTKQAKFIRANSLQKNIVRQLWKFRTIQVELLKKIHKYESFFKFIFSGPVITGSLLLLANQDSEESFDVVTVFEIIFIARSLKVLLTSLSIAMGNYQDFEPAYQLFNLYFKHVNRSPTVGVFQEQAKKKTKEKIEKASIQVPRGFRKQTALERLAEVESKHSGASFVFDNCSFVDRKVKTRVFLDLIFSEKFMGGKTRLDGMAEDKLVLNGVRTIIKKGSKVCVVGGEDSGWQFFMDCLSNEHELADGVLFSKGKVVHFDRKRYSLLDVSILENIILDRKLNRKKLDKVLASVGLSILEFVGGEKGSLKENQKIAEILKVKLLLARALYCELDIMVISNLMDELSFNERMSIFDNVVKGYLALNTVVFHSNDRALIDRADYVLVFEGGKIAQQGNPCDLEVQRGGAFELLTQVKRMNRGLEGAFRCSKLEERKRRRRNPIFGLSEVDSELVLGVHQGLIRKRLFSVINVVLFMKRLIKAKSNKKISIAKAPQEHEKMCTESIISSVSKFLKLHSNIARKLIIVLSITSGFLIFAFDTWLGYWSNTKYQNTDEQNQTYFWVLLMISLSSALFNLFRDMKHTAIIRTVSTKMFFGSVKTIIQADEKWFEKMSIPLIIYNITNYQIVMDDEFGEKAMGSANSLIMMIFSFLIANICFPGYFAVVTIILFYFMNKYVKKVLRTVEITIPKTNEARVQWFDCYSNACSTLSR